MSDSYSEDSYSLAREFFYPQTKHETKPGVAGVAVTTTDVTGVTNGTVLGMYSYRLREPEEMGFESWDELERRLR